MTEEPDPAPVAADVPAAEPRPLRSSVALGVGIGVGVALITYFVIAIPIYLVASFEQDGLDRPVIRDALFLVALPVAVLLGIACGAYATVALRRGDRWPVGRDEGRFTN